MSVERSDIVADNEQSWNTIAFSHNRWKIETKIAKSSSKNSERLI